MPKTESRILREIPFFDDFTDEELAELEPHISIKFFKADTHLREEAGQDLQFYVIRSGEVAVVKGHGTPGEVRLATLGENDLFGEMAFISDAKRGATVLATKDTSTASLPLGLLLEYEKRQPAIAAKFYRQFLLKVIERVRTMNERVRTMSERLEAKAK
ncbi:MAG: cyclic nucleotide-binding domain-containing protein [Acidobacteriota bacterium]|nr:MAG: cyclic nucleotide-binding domain-containing protein [Acidobacteriota bacterium]